MEKVLGFSFPFVSLLHKVLHNKWWVNGIPTSRDRDTGLFHHETFESSGDILFGSIPKGSDNLTYAREVKIILL